MNFIDATNAMQTGSKCVRQGWSGLYLVILAQQSYIWCIRKDNENSTNATTYIPSVNDIIAQDWLIKS